MTNNEIARKYAECKNADPNKHWASEFMEKFINSTKMEGGER